MKDSEDPKDALEPSAGARSRDLVLASVQTVPALGPVAAWLLAQAWPSPLSRRLVELLSDITDRITDLETSERLDREKLLENDAFQAAIFRAIPSAMGTVSQEKRRALRNVALNAALGILPADDLFEMFLRYVDDFTGLHIKLLQVAEELKSLDMAVDSDGSTLVFDVTVRARQKAIEGAYPELRGLDGTYEQAWSELVNRGLVKDDHDGSVFSNETGLGVDVEYLTPLGRQFLDFISDPG